MTLLPRFLQYYLFSLLVWLPVPLGSNRPWAWLILQISAFSLVLACVLLNRHNEYLGLKKTSWPIVLWLAFIVLSFMQIIPLPLGLLEWLGPDRTNQAFGSALTWQYLSTDPGQSQVSFIKTLSYFCVFLSCLMLINDEKQLRRLLIVMVLSGTLQAIYGVLEILSGSGVSLVFDLPVSESATGSFVYKNHFANFLMLCLSAGIGLMMMDIQNHKAQKIQDWRIAAIDTLLADKTLIRLCLAIMVIALVMSRSRMGNTAFFSAMIVVGIFTFLLEKKKSRGLVILLVSMLVIDLFIVSKWFGLEKVQQRLVETSFSDETRDEVLVDSLAIVGDYPLFGTGGGSFYSVFPSYKNAVINAFYDHAHNDYLELTIEYGLIGLAILGLLLLFALLKAVKALKDNVSPLSKGCAFACLMAYIGMLIHISVDFPLQAPANAVYFVVFIALPFISHNIVQLSRKK